MGGFHGPCVQGLKGPVMVLRKVQSAVLCFWSCSGLGEIYRVLNAVKQFCGGFSKVSPKTSEGERKGQVLPLAFKFFFLIMKAGLFFSFYLEEQSQGNCDSAYIESLPSMSAGRRFCCIAVSDALYR